MKWSKLKPPSSLIHTLLLPRTLDKSLYLGASERMRWGVCVGNVCADAVIWWWCSPAFLWRHTAQCWRWNRTAVMSSSGFIRFLLFHRRLLLLDIQSCCCLGCSVPGSLHWGGWGSFTLSCILGFIPFSSSEDLSSVFLSTFLFLKSNFLSLKQKVHLGI